MKNTLPNSIKISIIAALLLVGAPHAFAAGGGTIPQLDQFTSTTSPSSAITQTTWGKKIKLTGLTTGLCLSLDSNSFITTSACSGGGGTQTPWTQAIEGGGFDLNDAGIVTAKKFVATSTLDVSSFQQLLANGSTTLQNFTFLNATGTNATTTSFFATTASSTNFFGAGLSSCNGGTNALIWSGGKFSCNTISAGGTGTVTSVGASTPNSTLTIGGTNPVITNGTISFDLNLAAGNVWTAASTTFTGGITAAKATTTQATTTNFAITSLSSQIPYANSTGSIGAVSVSTGLQLAGLAGNVLSNTGVISVSCTTITCSGTNPASFSVGNGAISNAQLANSTISGVALGSTLNALTATNGTLTFSGSYDGTTARTIGLNVANGNVWTASTTFTGGFTATNSTTTNATTTNLVISALSTNGFVKTTGSNGSLTVDTTTYQAAGNYITALTGDVTASGPGSVAATLATVNTNTGSWGSSTAIPNFTVNGKGLITAAGTNAVVAPAGTLSGTTLNSTVVTSSLTAIGTLASGAVPASLVTSGTFGSGNYIFPGQLQVNSSTTLQNFTALNATTSNATTTSLAVTAVKSALHLADANGVVTAYGGTSCTNQFPRSLSAIGVASCASVANTDLANSTISGVALGSTLGALTATDSTLTFSGSYTGALARTVGLNLANGNVWTAASTTFTGNLSITGNSTTTNATTTNFSVSAGHLTVGSNNGFVSATSTRGFNIASTTLDAMGKSFNIGTTTLLLMNNPTSIKLLGFYCTASTTGTALVRFSHDNGNATETSTCTSGGYTQTSTNNTWTANEDFNVQASSTAGTVNRITVTPAYINTSD